MNLARRLCFTAAFLALVLIATGCRQEKAVEETGENGKQTEETMEQNVEDEGEEAEESGEQSAAEPVGGMTEAAGEQMNKVEETLKAGMGQAGEYLDDTAITAQIKMEMLQDPLLKDAEITVSTTSGVVTFTGTVPSGEAADRATQIATNITAVISVDNQLEITGE